MLLNHRTRFLSFFHPLPASSANDKRVFIVSNQHSNESHFANVLERDERGKVFQLLRQAQSIKLGEFKTALGNIVKHFPRSFRFWKVFRWKFFSLLIERWKFLSYKMIFFSQSQSFLWADTFNSWKIKWILLGRASESAAVKTLREFWTEIIVLS